jgi:D-sedoheptulose 7-phosphate isomerase
MLTIGLLGFDGGVLNRVCDMAIVIRTPQGEYGPVEDIHMVLDHLIGSYFCR